MTVRIHSFRNLRHSKLSLILLVAFAAFFGCGGDNSSGGSSSPPDWVVLPSGGQHAKSATRDYIAESESIPCMECHGADLSGGTSQVSCFENPAGCHHGPVSGWIATSPADQNHGVSAKQAPGSSGFVSCQICHGRFFSGGESNVPCFPCHEVNAPHPAGPWQGPTYTHIDTNTENAPVCAQCHYPGSPNNPSSHPSTPAAAETPPGCFNSTLCHGETVSGVNHSVPFPGAIHTSADQTGFDADCSVCHAMTGVSPSSVAPLCTLCHQSATALPFTNCTSCHARPPSGTDYPDVAGSHARHDALANVTEVCDSCHNGLGFGTAGHYDRANARPGKDASRVPPGEVAFLAAYNAKAGPAAFDNATLTCANVSCHGGQATPDWQTSTADAIDVPNACLNCHVSGTTQYNSYNSGMHDRHITEFGLSATTCKLCHDVAKVTASGHFQNLSTPAFEQPAAETILPALTYTGPSCDPNKGGLTGCHKKRNW